VKANARQVELLLHVKKKEKEKRNVNTGSVTAFLFFFKELLIPEKECTKNQKTRKIHSNHIWRKIALK